MPLKSDFWIDADKFHPDAISDQTHQVNENLMDVFGKGPKWYEEGAGKYREMRRNRETAFPPPELMPEGLEIDIPSRQRGRNILCRLMFPSARKTAEQRKHCKGTFLHFHGGGWVLGDHLSADELMLKYANAADSAVLSVGYRLAPENPFPKGPEDCFDTAEYLIQNSVEEYGGPLRFLGGESAGAHLSLLTAYHLFSTHPGHRLSGLLLHFGCYDLSLTPSARNFTQPLILNTDLISRFIDTFLSNPNALYLLSQESGADFTPNTSAETKIPTALPYNVRTHPAISPYYQSLSQYRGMLPPALFTCGTVDPLLDDSIMMSTKWGTAGGKSVLKVYPGGPHGFLSISKAEGKLAAERDYVEFLEDCLGGT